VPLQTFQSLAAWLHDLDPFALRIAGDFGIRWYGLAYIGGFVAAWIIWRMLGRRGLTPLRPERVSDAMVAIVLGVLVGGRLGYVLFYQPSLLIDFSPSFPFWGVLAINRGGMASHGGMLGLIAASWWIGRTERIPPLHMLDLLCLVGPIGAFLGRLANFVNGELLGRVIAPPGEAGPWWSVRFPQELLTGHAPELTFEQQSRLLDALRRVAPTETERALESGASLAPAVEKLIAAVQNNVAGVQEQIAPLLAARHPSQLYQAAAEGPVLMLALWLVWMRPRKPGVVTAVFLITYGALRVLTEIPRLPDDHLANQYILGLSRGQLLSCAMVLAGAILLPILLKRDVPRLGGWRTPRPERTAGMETPDESA